MFAQHQHIDPFLSFDTFCNLTFLTFDPLSVGRTMWSPWTLLYLRSRLTHWPFYFCHLTYFAIWPFFDLWPFNLGSDEEVTVDTYACLILSHEHVQVHARENLCSYATNPPHFRVRELLLCDILITRAGDGRWPRNQAKSLACPRCVQHQHIDPFTSVI